MKIEGDLDNMRIVGPVLRPFSEMDALVCPACGMQSDYWWRRALRRLKGKKVIPIAKAAWCPGDKPPTEQLSPVARMMWGSGEVVNRCAGIPHPHLHYTCHGCSAQWLSMTKGNS